MPLDDLPGTLIIPSRDDIRDQYLRDVRIRTPGASTVEGTLEYADASVFADQQVPMYFDIKNIGDHVANVNKKGKALDEELILAGTERLLATGGSGFVQVRTSSGGGTIFSGDEIKDPLTQLRFKCMATGLYTDGQYVPIIGVDTGGSTNLAAGTKLQWTTPRPGINPQAIVVEQPDGSGLSGGRDDETDDQANERLRQLRANPPASGNDTEYQALALKTPGIAIQQVFTYPCIKGPGSIGVTFTLRPSSPGTSRIPNGVQLAACLAWLTGQMPADDSILMCTLVASPVTLVFEATWVQQASSWADASPWPLYIPGDMVKVDGAVTPTTTTFRLTTATVTTDPQIGQTISFYDRPNGVFRKKRILTVTTIVATKSWDITVDTSNDSSDVNYVPLVGQECGPWSNSLQALVTPITTYFDYIGPGEQISPLPDPNLRQRRSPRSPTAYGNLITNRIVTPLFALPAVDDIQLIAPSVPYATPTGSPGISSYLLTLGNIVVFPQ